MIEVIKDGSVTSAKGFSAGATYAGLKTHGEDKLDLTILVSDTPAAVAATFTTNKVESRSVTLSRKRVQGGVARAVVVNSGCANACVGEQGLIDAEEMTSLAAKHVGVTPEEMLICSTGIIGVELPMALIRQHMGNIRINRAGGHTFTRAIMTTDSHPKEIAVTQEIDGHKITVGGAVKGAGMIHPNMATMLGFITTDARVELSLLRKALSDAVATSFNMVDVDGDQSTNDTVILLANGAAGGQEIKAGTNAASLFQEALNFVCVSLAKEMVRDAEGAQRLIEVVVDGARTQNEARLAARTIAGSLLVKAMVHGQDPNWGRLMMALGKSGVSFDEASVDIYINDIQIVHGGVAIPFFQEAVVKAMAVPEVRFRISLNKGRALGTAWGCDLTEDYVTINSAYST